jgi:hypothetical protein
MIRPGGIEPPGRIFLCASTNNHSFLPRIDFYAPSDHSRYGLSFSESAGLTYVGCGKGSDYSTKASIRRQLLTSEVAVNGAVRPCKTWHTPRMTIRDKGRVQKTWLLPSPSPSDGLYFIRFWC